MGEYLSPGIYTEFIEPLNPIEPVSTSTAAVVGVTERGPENVPILVTAPGEFEYWFGSKLDRDEFRDPVDSHRAHCYLPHAVDGFFINGGRRLYVVRVAPAAATRAELDLFARGPDTTSLSLLTRAGVNDGDAAAGGLLVTPPTGTIAANEWVRIGNGSTAEYRQVATFTQPGAGTNGFHLALDQPLRNEQAIGANVVRFPEVPVANRFQVTNVTPLPAPPVVRVTLAAGPGIDLAAPAVVRIAFETSAGREIRQVTAVAVVTANTVYDLTLNSLPSGTLPAPPFDVRLFTTSAAVGTIEQRASAGSSIVALDVSTAISDGLIGIGAGPTLDQSIAVLAATLPLTAQLGMAVEPGATFEHVQVAPAAGATAASITVVAHAGERTLTLDSRDGLAAGTVVRIGDGTSASPHTYGIVTSLFGAQTAAPNPGVIVLEQPLTHDYLVGADVLRVDVTAPGAPHPTTSVIAPAAADATGIAVLRGNGWVTNDFVRISGAAGIGINQLSGNAVALRSARLTLVDPLDRQQAAGAAVVERARLIGMQALDRGGWGNRLLVSVEDETSGLGTGASLTNLVSATELRVSSLSGIEPGTVLEVAHPNTGSSVVVKVVATDASQATARLLAPGLDAAALATLGPLPAGQRYRLRTREFRLTVLLRRPPDPATPSRNDEIIATEIFRNLSMDPRHSRYFMDVIGSITGPLRLSDRRPEGESILVRVEDLGATQADRESIRLGAETLVDLLPNGRTSPARHAFAGGLDAINTITDAVYLGLDAIEPEARTGLFALRNLSQISLVAVPGQGSTAVQAGLIAHCELMRHRFAVLDAERADSALVDVQTQRQQYDTRHAALYYPWLTIPDPMPINLATIGEFPIPPSGHMMGIYARTDVEQGVHAAPANAVVRGIVGLTRSISKGEHDILNPSPININVIRDFRPEGRSLRVWGARTITSDTSRKYVNVNRLIQFIERSLEIGLQWVVFRPNAEPLWDSVTRAITFFLTDVWRSGALEGTRPSEGFFVRCDRSTMTQSDIDNGRLICLVGIAPVKPAEFVIIRLAFLTRTVTQE